MMRLLLHIFKKNVSERKSKTHVFFSSSSSLLLSFPKKITTHPHTHTQIYLGFVAKIVLCLGSEATVLTHTNPHPSNISSMFRLKYSSEKGSVDFINIAMGFGSFWMMGERGSLSVMAKVPPGARRRKSSWAMAVCMCVCVCVYVCENVGRWVNE
jgi:hypothetical protein